MPRGVYSCYGMKHHLSFECLWTLVEDSSQGFRKPPDMLDIKSKKVADLASPWGGRETMPSTIGHNRHTERERDGGMRILSPSLRALDIRVIIEG